MSSFLFSPFKLRKIEFKNRIFVSPMCQYSANDGVPNQWHLVHLGSRAVGGAAMVMAEATAVSPIGRISPGDTGIWNDEQAEAFQPIASFIESQGAVPAIQLAHAGRKASTNRPWEGGGPLTPPLAWTPLAPSAIPFTAHHPAPRAMTAIDLSELIRDFARATERAREAGFKVLEIHMAHGYLLHEFLSPLTNQRTDAYGGVLENRLRLPLEVTSSVRAVWPNEYPLFVRVSATDWVEGGWDLEQSVILARALKERGVDLIDCSSGGTVPDANVPAEPGYQVKFAEAIRARAKVSTGAVGLITEPEQAEMIISGGRADAVFLARELLRDPYWPLRAASALKAEIAWPPQYERARR